MPIYTYKLYNNIFLKISISNLIISNYQPFLNTYVIWQFWPVWAFFWSKFKQQVSEAWFSLLASLGFNSNKNNAFRSNEAKLKLLHTQIYMYNSCMNYCTVMYARLKKLYSSFRHFSKCTFSKKTHNILYFMKWKINSL